MAPGMLASEDPKNTHDFPAKLTCQVFICSIIAAFGGLMFGYDIGISGNVYVDQSPLPFIAPGGWGVEIGILLGLVSYMWIM